MDNKIIIYGTGCPKCNVLKKKLDEKNIAYDEFINVEEMLKMGIEEVPVLSVENKMLNFTDAVKWIKEY